MRRILLPVIVLVTLAAAPPDQGGTLAERYEHARTTLEHERQNEMEMRAARDRIAGEAETLQERLIANASRVQDLELASAATAAQIAQLTEREHELSARFESDREAVGHLLAVLQRLDADEPPALIVRSDDSLAAARGAMMLGTMLPPVYERAAVLGRQLRELTNARAALELKNRQALEEAEALQSARGELSQLLSQKREEAAAAEERLQEIAMITQEAARETSDLRSLIDRIAELRAQDDPEQGMVVVAPGAADRVALERGSLIRPVVGEPVPGDSAGPGRTPGTVGALGLWFYTGGAAQAVAPSDSEVIFAGAYQKFGQVLILELADGYHLLLAGFDRIDVQIGDLVLAGEPVGVLPNGETSQLYLELRRNNLTIDPAPWMSAELRKASR